jgi:GTP-binding protein
MLARAMADRTEAGEMIPEPDAVGAGRDGPVIAIDGPAGSGKSTLARRLATALGLPYVNTGLMYRALARTALARGIDPDDAGALADVLDTIGFQLDDADPQTLLVGAREPGPELQTGDVEAIVSRVSRHPAVRTWMRDAQRKLGARGAVMEGRDIGTVVFPDADAKFFLAAPLGVRAERRAGERGGRNGSRAPHVVDVGHAVDARDRQDAATNPMEPAPGAHVLDTTALDADQVFDAAMELVASEVGDLRRADEASGRARSAPRVAIVGRQNVGKSTLLNRLAGRKVAIAHETPGVTRDRLEVAVTWGGRSFVLVDTGGFVHGAAGIEASVATQAARAAREADLVLLIVDASTGVQEEDATLARRILRSGVPALVVANKVDGEGQDPEAAAFISLGLGEPMPVSALHGRGAGDLLDRVADTLPSSPERRLEDEVRFAIVGKPNVGKSSLFNRIVRDERSVVHEQAGTTRDAVDSVIVSNGMPLRFVDTAGLRRRTRTQGVEFYGLLRTERAIASADVALLVIDATAGLTAEDRRIAVDVAEAGRGLVITLNKWDLVDPDEREHLFKYLRRELRMFPGSPVLRTSALRGTGVRRVIPSLLEVRENWTRRAPTAEVNRALERYAAKHPPPRGVGRIRYGTQVGTRPPTFVVFGIGDPGDAYRRYLERSLRRDFGFDGAPVRISFRAKGSKAIGRDR